MKPLKLKIILGSTRAGRFSEIAGAWIAEQAKKHPEFETEVLDLRVFEMPFFDQAVTSSSKTEPYTNPAVVRWTQKIAEADAFVVVTPEYNHSTSAVLKNAMDWVSSEWNKKAVGYLAYGSLGGARAVEHLRNVAAEQGMVSVRNAVHILTPWMLREDYVGPLKAGSLDQYEHAAEGVLTQLKEWASATRTMRMELVIPTIVSADSLVVA